MQKNRQVLWQSLLLTLLIFAVGVLLNHFFDVFRIETIVGVMRAHEIDNEAYGAEQFFTTTFGGEECDIMTARIADFKEEIRKVGEDLGSYSRFSFFRRKDYDYLKRKYFLLELNFFSLIQRINKECGSPYVPVLFFYKIDDDASERQGFILQDLSKEYDKELVVLSLDMDYTDEPLVGLLAKSYNVSAAPALVIEGKSHEGLLYGGEINGTLVRLIRRADPYTQGIDFNYTVRAAGINVSQVMWEFERIEKNESAGSFARGDARLVRGRLTGNDSLICSSLEFFDQVNSSVAEEMAVVYETSASLGCGRNRAAFLHEAAVKWREVGNQYRANLDEQLARAGHVRLDFDPVALKANGTVQSGYLSVLLPNLSGSNNRDVVVGRSSVLLNRSSVLLSQDDRVFRDWLSGQLADPYGPTLLRTFSERLTYNASELLPDVGWHEGGRIFDLERINLTHKVAVGSLVAKSGSRWFAIDNNGTFRFEVPIDKISYPTTRFLRRDLAVVVDTHGVNMLVEQALRMNASVVVGCCDHPGKIYAAKYLSDRGIPTICYTDKYLYLALGHSVSAVGSPPVVIRGDQAIVGKRPMELTSDDRIVAVNASDKAYALWYYQTPASYMTALQSGVALNVTIVTLDNFGQMSRATDMARKINASVLATRVFNSDDYMQVKLWLDEDEARKVLLFHSASYPYGQKILREYPSRSSFDDPNPVIS